MRPAAVPRVVLALLAIVVIAWLGVLLRDQRLLKSGVEVTDVGRADRDLRRARLLNPDTAPDVSRALRWGIAGDRRKAIKIVDEVVRREPDNFYAWAGLRTLARGRDPAANRRAAAALRRLDPLGAQVLGRG